MYVGTQDTIRKRGQRVFRLPTATANKAAGKPYAYDDMV